MLPRTEPMTGPSKGQPGNLSSYPARKKNPWLFRGNCLIVFLSPSEGEIWNSSRRIWKISLAEKERTWKAKQNKTWCSTLESWKVVGRNKDSMLAFLESLSNLRTSEHVSRTWRGGWWLGHLGLDAGTSPGGSPPARVHPPGRSAHSKPDKYRWTPFEPERKLIKGES